MKIASKHNRKFKSFSKPKRIAIELELNQTEYKKLSFGSLPESMDDKWYVILEDGILTCYRSWTCIPVFQSKIHPTEYGKYRIEELKAETDQERINLNSDEQLIHMFKNHITYLTTREIRNSIEDGLLGFVVGDALGVPVEFKSRDFLKQNPIIDMSGYGTYNQPRGTWSDDSTMTFCLAETLLDEEFSLRNLANRFINWVDWGYWTPHGKLFDIGNTTLAAIDRLRTIDDPTLAGGRSEEANGNGSLMRVLPLMFEHYDIKDEENQYEAIKKVASLTHGHERSILACFYYLTFVRYLKSNYYSPIEMYKLTNKVFRKFVDKHTEYQAEIKHFGRLLTDKIHELENQEIKSTGYVIDTLEASVWCLLTTKNYKDAVLKAVNLGEDTDTIGAITGSLAGLSYGRSQIPDEWISSLAKIDEIELLIDKLCAKYNEARC